MLHIPEPRVEGEQNIEHRETENSHTQLWYFLMNDNFQDLKNVCIFEPANIFMFCMKMHGKNCVSIHSIWRKSER